MKLFDRFGDKIVYSFSDRRGGVSEGIYESLNLSNSMGDDPELVRENFRIWLERYGVNLEDVVSLKQVHGANVLVADSSHCGSGPIEGRIEGFDGLVTNVPGLALVTGHADCTPVYIYDPVRNAIGMVHAGWRGTTLEIAARAVKTMVSAYSCEPADMYAMIGPCIHIENFECDRDVIDAIDKMSIDASEYYYFDEESGKYHASVPDINKAVLVSAGIPESNIEVSPECTYELADKYFSHRRQGDKRGGQAALLMLKKQ